MEGYPMRVRIQIHILELNRLQKGQDSSVGKKLDLQSIERRFEPYCRQSVFLALAFSKPLTLKLLARLRNTTVKTM